MNVDLRSRIASPHAIALIVRDALQTLDFQAIRAYMEQTNWTYYFDPNVPSIATLRVTAEGLVRSVIEELVRRNDTDNVPFFISTGGFIAEVGGDIDVVRIRFSFSRTGDAAADGGEDDEVLENIAQT